MTDPYPFDPSFERSIVALLVSSTPFYNRVGPHLDPARFKDKKAQLLAAEARDLYETVGKPPGADSVVLQCLRTKHERGKLAASLLAECADYLMDAYDYGLPEVDVAVHEVAKVIKRIKQQATLDTAFTTFAERGDMTDVAEELRSVEDIGKIDVSYGGGLDDFGAEIDGLGGVECMPTGFRELDAEMGGGPARGEFFFWLAGTKVGKTMALVQNAAIAFMRGMFVCVPTLELDTVKWRARVLGTVTGTPYQDILTYGSKSIAFARLREMREDSDFTLGRLSVHKFGGHQTTLTMALDWVKREEDRHKVECEALVADYADKFIGKLTDSDYIQMRDVYEGYRLHVETRKIWGWSASQAQRIALGEMPTINHCADSQHKVRTSDGMIGLCRDPDNENKVSAKVLAKRSGTGDGAEAGPLPNGFDYGCFVRNCATGVDVEIALTQDGPDLGVFS